MIATVHEDSQYTEETFSTLQFAIRASKIKMSLNSAALVSENITLDGAKRQIKLLRQRLQVSLRGYISILVVSCFMWSGSLDSSGLLL